MDPQAYSETYSKVYTGEAWFESALVEVRRRKVIQSLNRHPHNRILEIGCGLESSFPAIAQFDSFTIVEPSKLFTASARDKAKGRNNVHIIEDFIESVKIPEACGPFDFIIASSLLHEVSDPARVVRAVGDLCTDDTIVHFNVPNVYSFHRLLALEMGLIDSIFEQSEMERKFSRFTRFDRNSFVTLLQQNGFEVIVFETYFIKPFSHRQMEQIFDKSILDRKALDAFDSMVKYMPDLGAEMYVEARRLKPVQ